MHSVKTSAAAKRQQCEGVRVDISKALTSSWVVYGTPIIIFIAFYLTSKRKHEREARAAQDEAVEAGLTEPASLHPVIDPARCIGCATCVKACPEHTVLGVINGKAELVGPTNCIGHGACAEACPVGAIDLVFGTQRRGVDIPVVSPDFETNVPGIFIAGELGGMGLIRNAITQGRQAMDAIHNRLATLGNAGAPEDLQDVVIVGAGPAGFAASLAAKDKGLAFVTLEQESFGGTVAHYPRGKIVMTAPVTLPIVGKAHFSETTKEELMSFWQGIRQKTGLEVQYSERVKEINHKQGYFEVVTERNAYNARAVLLAIGRRGTPRKLLVNGENLPKVVYRLIDPEQYRSQSVLVVGGGDSALEAALSLVQEPDTTVAISYRGEAFGRAKQKNRERIQDAQASGALRVYFNSTISEISENEVVLDHGGSLKRLNNDAIVVCAGGILPSAFLKDSGVSVETKYGTR